MTLSSRGVPLAIDTSADVVDYGTISTKWDYQY